MFKPAVIAAAVFVCAPLVWASTAGTDVDLPAPATIASEPACRATSALDAACPLHAVEQADVSPLALPEPATLADARPDVGAGITFKDVALAPAVTLLASTREHDNRKPIAPALFALLAMTVLLSRRHTSF